MIAHFNRPVSYTHLDVYKRQSLPCALFGVKIATGGGDWLCASVRVPVLTSLNCFPVRKLFSEADTTLLECTKSALGHIHLPKLLRIWSTPTTLPKQKSCTKNSMLSLSDVTHTHTHTHKYVFELSLIHIFSVYTEFVPVFKFCDGEV